MSEGGVDIIIHQAIATHITHMRRIIHRTIKHTIRSNKSHTPVTIVNTYAPHKGERNPDQKEHWGEAQQSTQWTPGKHLIIWRADANGEIGELAKNRDGAKHNSSIYKTRKGERKW